MPLSIVNKKLKETSKMEEMEESEEEIDVEVETTSETKGKGLNRNKRDPPKKIPSPFSFSFFKKRSIRIKSIYSLIRKRSSVNSNWIDDK